MWFFYQNLKTFFGLVLYRDLLGTTQFETPIFKVLDISAGVFAINGITLSSFAPCRAGNVLEKESHDLKVLA